MLRACSRLLRRAKITAVDFAEAVKDVRAGDFVYLDPPFMVARRRVFNEYSAKPFGHTDLERLAEVLEVIDRAGAVFVVSYADSSEGRRVLAKWRPARVRTRRNIAGFSKHRKHAYELMATNMASIEQIGEAQGGKEETS
jgi:DNA adenine methylase